MESSYRLRRIVGGRSHAAVVAVRVESSSRDEVAVSHDVFGWRREVYGPGALSGGPFDERIVAGAVEGVWYVLARSGGAGGGRRVTVTAVCDSPADTEFEQAKFAAAMATCQALGVELDRPPFIDASGVVFPGGALRLDS